MATYLGMLLAYDATGAVVGTLDYKVAYGPDGAPLGLVDFASHEAAGGSHTDIWTVTIGTVPAVGSKMWPEWLGGAALGFKVELVGPPGAKKIGALIHLASGHRRERAAIETAIDARIAAAGSVPANIRDLVGGPDRPISIDSTGRTLVPAPVALTVPVLLIPK